MGTNTVQNANGQPSQVARAFITISTTSTYCDDFNNNVMLEDETLVFVNVTDSNTVVQDTNNIPTFTGNWNFISDSDPSLAIDNSDAQQANCLSNPNKTIQGHAASGTLSIAAASATTLQVTLDAKLDAGEQATGALQGVISATLCPALAQDSCTRHYVCNK